VFGALCFPWPGWDTRPERGGADRLQRREGQRRDGDAALGGETWTWPRACFPSTASRSPSPPASPSGRRRGGRVGR